MTHDGTGSSDTHRLAYQPALDGLRAAAVVAVLLYHGGVAWMRGGYLGVDAFFVLSGFLITGLLLAEWQAGGTIRLRAFWARRARRLLPALVLVLVGVAVYAALLAPAFQLDQLRGDGFSTLGYVANWRLIFSGQGYFDRFALPSPLRHTWSLAIEEQFYLVWPLLTLAFLGRWRAGARQASRARAALKRFTIVCFALAMASALAMALLALAGVSATRLYYGTDTRAQALLIGATLAALTTLRGPVRSVGARRSVRTLALVGVGVTAVLWTQVGDNESWLYRGGYLLAALAVAAVIADVTQPGRGVLRSLLSPAPVRWVGRVSYGLYLWHWPVYVVMTPDRTGLSSSQLLAPRLGGTLVLATLSYYTVELPIRRGALRSWRAWTVVPATATALVVVLLLVTAGGHTLFEKSSRSSVLVSASSKGPSTAQPLATGPEPPTRVLITGDSVAATLGLGLEDVAQQDNLFVRDAGGLGCGLITGGDVWYEGAVTPIGSACSRWRSHLSVEIATNQPQVAVLLVGTWDAYDRLIDGHWVNFGTPESDALLLNDLRDAANILSAGGARVVVLTTPYLERKGVVNPPAHWRSAFDKDRVDHLNQLYRSYASTDHRVTVVDLNHFLSPDGQFHDEIGGQVIQDDGVHFGLDGRLYVARWLAPRLKQLALVPASGLPHTR